MAGRRREHGTGSLYQRKDGIWVGTIEAGWTRDGKRRRITVSGKTKTIAQKRLRDKRNQIDRDGATDASARATIKSWSAEWLTQEQTRQRPKPFATDASAVRKWIIPTIGHRRLDQLTPGDVRAVAQAQRAAGRSTTTAHRTHGTLLRMLKDAIVEGHAVPQRILLVDPPGKAPSDRDAMSDAEALSVLAVASILPHGSRWLVQMLYGTRQAETLGLTWDAVDFDAETITVEWQLQALPYNKARDKASGFKTPDNYKCRHLVDAFHLVEVKTAAGERVLPLHPAVAKALRAWREVAPENPYGLIWPNAKGRPCNEKDDREEWHAIQCAAETSHPTSPRWWHTHEARHGLATALMEHGEDEAVVTALMGHSSMLSTKAYKHVRQSKAREAIAKVAARLELD